MFGDAASMKKLRPISGSAASLVEAERKPSLQILVCKEGSYVAVYQFFFKVLMILSTAAYSASLSTVQKQISTM